MTRIPTLLPLALLVFIAASCADEGSSTVFECTTDADCRAGWVCERSSSHGTSVCRERSDLQDTSTAADTSDASLPEQDIAAIDTAVDTGTRDTDDDTSTADTTTPDTTSPDPCNGLCTGATACCSGQCFDLSSSNLHCGACGSVCSSLTPCCEGRCGSVAENLCCPGVGWVDSTSDRENCGACGNDCRAGDCSSGTCETVVSFDGVELDPAFVSVGVGHFVVFSNDTTDTEMVIDFSAAPDSGPVPPGGIFSLEAVSAGSYSYNELYSGAAGVVTVE